MVVQGIATLRYLSLIRFFNTWNSKNQKAFCLDTIFLAIDVFIGHLFYSFFNTTKKQGGNIGLITVNVSLYGSIAVYAGGKFIATMNVELKEGQRIRDLLQLYKIPTEEKGYLFIDHVLCDAPGLNASLDEELRDGAHVGIFSITHMWPYQYRDGIPMSQALKDAMALKGTMHNTYYDK